MSRQNARDMRYGRRGGGWIDGTLDTSTAPSCEVCGGPMLGGQRRRHGVCSPRLDCCGAYTDLVGDMAKHVKAHQEIAAAGTGGEAGPAAATVVPGECSPSPSAHLPAAPRARRTDPGTAHAAARRATGGAAAMRAAVLRAHADAGPVGLSGDELATALGVRYEVCGPRRADLRDIHHVAPLLDERGRQVVRDGKGVWQITAAGYQAAAQTAVA